MKTKEQSSRSVGTYLDADLMQRFSEESRASGLKKSRVASIAIEFFLDSGGMAIWFDAQTKKLSSKKTGDQK